MSLRFGQTIRIRSYENKGFITSKSYTDSNLYFQIYNTKNNVIENNHQIIDIQNYRQSLFQILPTSSFEINDEMNSMKDQTKKLQSLPRAKTQQEQFKAIITDKKGKEINFGDKVVFKHLDSQYYMYGSFDCAKSGIGAFKLELRNELSEKIIFQLMSYRTYEKDSDQISLDAPLRIYHCETQCYLSYVQQNIFIDRDYQHFKESNIFNEDQLINQPYIKNFMYSIGRKQGFDNRESYQSHQSGLAEIQSVRYQIINQNIPKRVWRLGQHLQMQKKPNKQQIRNHDVVYFIHTKDDKYLCPDNFSNQTILKKRKGQTDVGQIFDGLWEIQERKQADDSLDQFKNMKSNRKILTTSIRSGFGGNFKNDAGSKPEIEEGAEKISSEKYIIRHLISGRIMYAQRSFQNVQVKYFERDSGQKPMLFECVDSKLADGALVKFKVKMRNKKQKHLCAKKIEKNNKLSQAEDVEPQNHLALEYQLMDDIQKTYEDYFEKEQLELFDDASEHGFRIYKVDDEIRQIALFILSSQQLLFKLTQFIDTVGQNLDQFAKDISIFFLNNIISVMRALIGFVYDCQYSKIAQSGSSPIVKRQRAFDELGMIELVTNLVCKINKNSLDLQKIAKAPFNRQSQYMKFRYIYVLGYQILECVAAGNYMEKIKISRYLQTYLSHVVKQQNKIVYKSIQEVLDDNYLALEKKISAQYIENLIGNFNVKSPDPADLQFLSRLCLCKERTVIQNQNQIFLNFFDKDQNKENKFKFREDQGKMQIRSRISATQPQQYRTLPEMYEECDISKQQGLTDPEKGHWNYFLEYLNLLADVSVNHNIKSQNYIQKNLPLKTLAYFLRQPVVKKKLLFQPFIRLVHYAFIQTKKFEEMSRITKVKNWNQLTNFEIPRSKQHIQGDLMQLLDYIKQYIRKINLHPWKNKVLEDQRMHTTINEDMKKQDERQPNCIEFDPQDAPKLKMVKTFLQIFKSTLSLGFWQKMINLKEIIPYMLKILSFDIQYADRELAYIKQKDQLNNQNAHLTMSERRQKVYSQIKQQLTLNKPSINNLVQCKLIAAQILDIIIDYEYNIKVSQITKYFKDVIQNEIDLSKYSFDRLNFLKKWSSNKQFPHFMPEDQKQGYLMIEEIWIDEIKKIIQERDVFSDCLNIDKYLVFFETFVYENKELSNLIMSIITKISSQRKNLLNTFKNIIIVTGGTLSKLAQRARITRSILLPLASFNVRSVDMKDVAANTLWAIVKQDTKQPIENQSKSMGAIQELAFLTMAMKKNGNPTPIRASKFYQITDLYPFKGNDIESEQQKEASDRSYLIIIEKQENNQLNQNLIKSQDHHLIIIDFIKNMSDTPKQKELPLKALHAAYNFLTVLVWNNFENKEYLYNLNILKITECHLSVNAGCIDFYKEMYTNNKSLVLKSDVTPLVRKVIQIANTLDLTYYHKSKLMDFIRVLVIFDQKGFEKNQNIVMQIISLYQVSDNNQIVYLKTPSPLSDLISGNYKNWIDNYMRSYKRSIQSYEDLYVRPQLFYIGTFFEVFSALIEGQNQVNIGKCNNMHPLDFLLEKVSISGYCWPVLRYLRAYINKLYYFQDRPKDSHLFETFELKDLTNIDRQLRGIVQLRYNCPQYSTIKITNPVRYAHLGSYIFLHLEEILHSLSLIFSNKLFETDITSKFNQASSGGSGKNSIQFKVLSIIEMLEYLQKTMDGRYINKYMAHVNSLLKKTIPSITLQTIQQYIQESKLQATKRMKQFTVDDVPFRKRYVFHQTKGFWRHLIDWNAFHEQQVARDKKMTEIQKRSEKDVKAESKQTQQNKKKEYYMDLIYLANIEKKIISKQAQKVKNNQIEENQKQQIITEQITNETALPKNLVTSKSNRFKIKNQRFPSFEVKNAVINKRRKKLVKFIEINPEFKKFNHQEIEKTLYYMFNQLNSLSNSKYGMSVVGKEDVVKSIVKMNKINPNSITPQYKLVIIRLLINYIQRQSDSLNKEISQLDFESIKEQERKAILQAQNFLHKCGVCQYICSLLMNDFTISTKMCIGIVRLAIMMLIGINKQVQNTMLELLKTDQKNVIFVELEKLIRDCTVVVASNASDPIQQQYRQAINYSDTYDYYDVQDNCMKRKFKFQPITIMQQRQFTQKYEFLQTAFVFLKVFCEGNNKQIKNYIRQQTENDQQKKPKQESINFISLAVSELKKIFLVISLKIIKVPFTIVDFINEVTQIPCLQNQLYLCESSFFLQFYKLSLHLQQTKVIPFNFENLQILNKFYSLNFKNIVSCLEGNRKEIQQLLSTENLCKYYVNAFAFEINNLPIADPNWKKFTNAKQLEVILTNTAHHENLIIDLFQITSVIEKLKHLDQTQFFTKKIKSQLETLKMTEYFNVFSRNMLGIQVHVDSFDGTGDGNNQVLFFPRHSVFNYLSRQTRGALMQTVNRSTQRDKITGLISAKDEITQQIDYNYYLDHDYKLLSKVPLSISSNKIQIYKNISLVLSTLLVFLLSTFSTVIYYPEYEEIQFYLGSKKKFIEILSYIQFSFASIYLILWLKNRVKLAYAKYQAQKTEPQSKLWRFIFMIPSFKALYCLSQFDNQFSMVMLFMLGSTLGAFYSTQSFSILLINLMLQTMDVLNNIVAAIVTNLRMLGMLSFLGGMFVAMFSIFALHYYAPALYPQQLPQDYCESMLQCISELYIRQEIGNDMQKFEFGRFCFDMLYTIFMDTLFGNIVAGVLIDSFAALRQKGQAIQNDKKGFCYICGVDKETLQKKNEDLKKHYKSSYHKLWNYVFYLYHLKQQKKKTGLQKIIEKKVQMDQVSWIPSNVSQGVDIGESIQHLQKQIQKQNDIINGLEVAQG